VAVRTYVLSYDVTEDRRRNKLHSLLESRGHWVQRSVFEVISTHEAMLELTRIATEATRFSLETDSLRCYPLCPECYRHTLILGQRAPMIVVPGAPLVL
jgi:CRISPR-associated protein Cas2